MLQVENSYGKHECDPVILPSDLSYIEQKHETETP